MRAPASHPGPRRYRRAATRHPPAATPEAPPIPPTRPIKHMLLPTHCDYPVQGAQALAAPGRSRCGTPAALAS